MNSINRLEQIFKEFPGIGPRQAKRFVYFLLTRNEVYLSEFKELIANLKNEISLCSSCFRFYPKNRSGENICPTCNDSGRDKTTLLIVSRDVDYENIEKTHTFEGLYFVLGGSVPILEKEPEKKIRLKKLLERVERDGKAGVLKEIIFALDVNPEGEHTEETVVNFIKETTEKFGIKISKLGRGLSTGLELEYSDAETLKNALKNRG